MSENLTWRDESGNIMTKATKAKLAQRLYRLERFLWACTCCYLEKGRIATTAKLMKTSRVANDASMQDFWRDYIARQIEQYRVARQKRDNMYAALTKRVMEEEIDYEVTDMRSLNREQAKRLLMVLRDNGIEPDECATVAEAICYVTDLDESVLQEVENEQ